MKVLTKKYFWNNNIELYREDERIEVPDSIIYSLLPIPNLRAIFNIKYTWYKEESIKEIRIITNNINVNLPAISGGESIQNS